MLENLSSEISIGVAHHRHEHVDLFIKWVDGIAAGRRRHPRSRAEVVVVMFLVLRPDSGFVWLTTDVCRCLARASEDFDLKSPSDSQSEMAANAQQQIKVTDLDIPQLADVRRQLDEVRLCSPLRSSS